MFLKIVLNRKILLRSSLSVTIGIVANKYSFSTCSITFDLFNESIALLHVFAALYHIRVIQRFTIFAINKFLTRYSSYSIDDLRYATK